MEEIELDRVSLIVRAGAATTLRAIETAMTSEGLTLRVDAAHLDRPLGAWLADGAPGSVDPWRDPVDHLVAGFEAVLADGTRLEVRPAPRRAVGPDLFALFFGARGRFGAIVSAWLRVHAVDARAAETDAFVHERSPATTAGEEKLLAALAREIGST